MGVWKQKRKEIIDQQVAAQTEKAEVATNITDLKAKIEQLEKDLVEQELRFSAMEARLEDLTMSDMYGIKGWLVDQYHRFYVEQGWIDAFSADTIEHRYVSYKIEGGNSYIDGLMERIRSLPMDPPNH
jgi:predicted RNase H-like nuclease (RuvC/YqgF family)